MSLYTAVMVGWFVISGVGATIYLWPKKFKGE